MRNDDLPLLSLGSVDPATLADEELMRALARAVDRSLADDLFSELFRRYESRVRAWCLRVIGDRDRAADLVQEVFLKAYCSIHTFRGDSRFSTWLYAIARNHCLNSRKKHSVEPVEITEMMCDHLPDESAESQYTAIERNQSYRLMWQLLSATLKPIELRVVTLHYAHEWPLAAITEQLSLSNRSGAKAYIVSARRKLQGLRQDASTAAA